MKLADFGLARRMEDQDYYLMGGKRVLPVRWMAPESLVYGLSTSASDVWYVVSYSEVLKCYSAHTVPNILCLLAYLKKEAHMLLCNAAIYLSQIRENYCTPCSVNITK